MSNRLDELKNLTLSILGDESETRLKTPIFHTRSMLWISHWFIERPYDRERYGAIKLPHPSAVLPAQL